MKVMAMSDKPPERLAWDGQWCECDHGAVAHGVGYAEWGLQAIRFFSGRNG